MTTKLRTYPKYKSSGIEWLGDIPNGWQILAFKQLFQPSNERIKDDPSVDTLLSVSGYRGVEPKDISSMEGQMPSDDISEYRIVRKGQLAVNTMWLNYAGLGVSEYEGYISPVYRAYDIKSDINKKFVHYLLRSPLYVQKYTSLLYGVRPNSLQVKPYDFEHIEVLLPSLEIQKQIADFLDEKTKVIDELMTKKEKLIEKQRELIFSLVLGNNAKTKSEIWGNVPDTWEFQNAREIFMEVDVRNKPEEELLAVTQDRGVLPKFNLEAQFVSPTSNEGQKLVEENDFVISLRSFEGGIEFSSYRGIVSPAYTILRLKDGYNIDLYKEYYKYLLKTPQFISYLNTVIMGIRDGKNISFYDFRNLILPIPPVNTIQSMLPEFKKYELSAHFLLKERKLFNEYRSSLIYHAVTGKIKI